MAHSQRPMSSLPTIKCSACGDDIAIAHLADHVCGADHPDVDAPPSQPPKVGRGVFAGMSASDARGRMRAPPSIDPAMANAPFRPRDQATPLSNYSNPRILSASPFSQRGSPSPMRRPSPSPSPQPTSRAGTPGPSSAGRQHDSYGASAPSYASDPYSRSNSPQTNASAAVSRRMDAIAPGPFGGPRAGSRPPSERSLPWDDERDIRHKRSATPSSLRSSAREVGAREADARTSVTSDRSRTSAVSNRSVGLPTRPKPGPLAPSRFHDDSPRSYTDPTHAESDRTRARGPTESKPLPRRPTDLGYGADPRPNAHHGARGTSQGSIPFDDGPRLAPVAYERLAPQRPLPTPSDSGQSDDSSASSYDMRSAASSRSSVPTSASSRTSGPNAYRSDASQRTLPRVAEPEPYAQSKRYAEPESYAPPMLAPTRYGYDVGDADGYDRGRTDSSSLRAPARPRAGPASPMDPAIQRGLEHQQSRHPSGARPRSPPGSQPRSPPRQRWDRDYEPHYEPHEPARRRPAAKARCKACREPIVGKSIKDAEGRLSGRYHRECFVCTTCAEPFPTADFYVLGDAPYCTHHYHERNGSLCQACHGGIEGRYLETEHADKFHTRCFACAYCQRPLADEYFEVGDAVYCERHALQLVQRNRSGKGRDMRKRRTRLLRM